MPGVMAGALLAFALSIDDYIITSFNAGNTVTFPLWVYGASRTGVPPQVNVMGTLIFVFGVRSRRHRLDAGPTEGEVSRLRAALGGRERVVVLARLAGSARHRCRRLSGADSADLVVVGGGYTGLWTALQAKEADPTRDVAAARGAHLRVGRVRPQRRILRGEPHARPRERTRPLPGRRADARPARPRRTSTRSRRPSTATASTAAFERTGELEVAAEPHQVDWLRESARAHTALRPRHGVPRSRRGAGRGRLADLSRRAVAPRPGRAGRPGAARLGTACGLSSTRRAHRRGHAGCSTDPAAGRRVQLRCGHRDATVYARPRRARDERVPGARCTDCGRSSCRCTTTCWSPSR